MAGKNYQPPAFLDFVMTAVSQRGSTRGHLNELKYPADNLYSTPHSPPCCSMQLFMTA